MLFQMIALHGIFCAEDRSYCLNEKIGGRYVPVTPGYRLDLL
jgi:hypothetical protein